MQQEVHHAVTSHPKLPFLKPPARRGLHVTHSFTFLTLIATMHSMVLSLRTQEMVGAATSSRLHFWNSASDLRHHLILAEGAAEAAAVG